MPQQLSLFAGSIRDNIARFADPDADERIDADVIAAAQLCGAHGMILRLPQGYDTMLGWGGMGLSMGQTQRIALARALFRDPAEIGRASCRERVRQAVLLSVGAVSLKNKNNSTKRINAI